MKCFLALAFLPTEDVASVFEELIDDDCISTEFISYFEFTYIRIARGCNPLYPIEMWNTRQHTLLGLPRISNAVEGFHSGLNSSATCVHPNFWKFCQAISAEETLVQIKILRAQR